MIKLLDCTLRDGGYINDWEFGEKNIYDVVEQLEKTNVDIIEIGFLKNEEYNKKRTVYNDVMQINSFIPNKKAGIMYAAMCEVLNPIPIEKISERTDETVDIIRVMIWKTKHDDNGKIVDCLQEGFEYCKGLKEKGYELCIQPARVDQYSDQEFIDMIHLYQELDPLAIYVVDSWGTLQAQDVIHYTKLAEKEMKPSIAIGYHGHNNMLQAFGIAKEFVEYETKRDLYVDASVYGIGRCAGNLNLEVFAHYLNEKKNKLYEIKPMVDTYKNVIESIYQKHPWGYSIPYFLTAKYHCNPNYGEYYGLEKSLSVEVIETILQRLSDEDKIIFSREKAEKYLAQT